MDKNKKAAYEALLAASVAYARAARLLKAGDSEAFEAWNEADERSTEAHESSHEEAADYAKALEN